MHYNPLKKEEIRLLRLGAKRQPAPGHNTGARHVRLRSLFRQEKEEAEVDSELECFFTTVPLDNCPEFEALSYAWGDETDTIKVNVNGEPVPVIPTLHSALRHLRQEQKDRILWIDRLCINQSDLNERSHQVTLMRRIYSQAPRTIVWLGDAWEGRDTAFDFIQLITGRKNIHLEPLMRKHLTLNGADLSDRKLREDLISFFAQPWWSRLWTVQEFVLAKSVTFQSGHRTLSEAQLILLHKMILKYDKRYYRGNHILTIRTGLAGHNLYSAINQVHRLNNARKFKQNSFFLSMVAIFRRQLASDPRDKIFGLLGLVEVDFTTKITPNYELPVERIFEDAVYVCIEEQGDLEVFSHIIGTPTLKLPSFVPDWTIQIIHLNTLIDRFYALQFYDACNGRRPIIKRHGEGTIACAGLVVDNIVAVGKLARESRSTIDTIQSCREVAQVSEDPDRIYSGSLKNQTISAAFSRTMCANIMRGIGFGAKIKEESDSAFTAKEKQWEASCIENLNNTGGVASDPKVNYYNKSVLANFQYRRFIRTSKGFIGVAAQRCLVGDLIVVLAGGRVPYVLRQMPPRETDSNDLGHSGTRYQILGDAYVHGIMHGEALLKSDGTELEMREIILE